MKKMYLSKKTKQTKQTKQKNQAKNNLIGRFKQRYSDMFSMFGTSKPSNQAKSLSLWCKKISLQKNFYSSNSRFLLGCLVLIDKEVLNLP